MIDAKPKEVNLRIQNDMKAAELVGKLTSKAKEQNLNEYIHRKAERLKDCCK